MKKIIVLVVCLLGASVIFAQNEREGDDLVAAGDYGGAAVMYRLCMDSNPQCRLKLFKLIYDRRIDPQFSDELYELISPLALEENPEAQYYLGMLYKEGRGVLRDNSIALNWLQRSADQGYVDARKELEAMQPAENPLQKITDENAATPVQNDYSRYQVTPVIEKGRNRSSALFVAGGACIIGGIAATILTPKAYTDYGNGKIVEGKEYNLVYAVAGVAAGSICIGSGISLKKKDARLSANRNDNAILNLVATGNGAGLRLTF